VNVINYLGVFYVKRNRIPYVEVLYVCEHTINQWLSCWTDDYVTGSKFVSLANRFHVSYYTSIFSNTNVTVVKTKLRSTQEALTDDMPITIPLQRNEMYYVYIDVQWTVFLRLAKFYY
jgi:hypothetical protein